MIIMKRKFPFILQSFNRLPAVMVLLFSFSYALYAQTSGKINVSGIVTDSKNEPLTGVSIVEKGSTNGTVSDGDGRYALSVNPNSTLQFSFLGFKTIEEPVNSRTTINVILQEEVQELNQVVVVGYGTMRKRDLTGAVASVSGNTMRDKPVADLGEALQGRAAGVQVISSGAPGSNVSFRIRGISTINNSEPLLVIDNVPTDLGINSLNMEDVESVDILKDASATAIYGSRGANGVVLVTTKKGKSGDGVISFNANWGTQEATKMPQMLNASQYASLSNEMIANYNQTYPLSPMQQRPDFADPASLGQGTDWLNALFRTAPMQNYTLSYSGGNDRSAYYVSGGVLDQQGIVINTSYRRYTMQFNSESKVRNWLKFGNNVTLSADIKKQGSYDIRQAMAALPTQPVYKEGGSYSEPGRPFEYYGDISNPVGKATIETQQTDGYNILGNAFAEITIFNKLVFKTLGGIDFKFWDDADFYPKCDWNMESKRYQDSYKSLTYLWDNTLTYNETFNKKHHLNIMVGSSAQNNVYNYMTASVQKFLFDANNQLNNGLENPAVGGTKKDWAILSFMGRANYNYADKYLLTATVRRDGSSRFSKTNRWGTFPSFSAAWRLSEEAFYHKNKWMSDIKIRAGYGETGNQDGINNYEYFTKLKTDQYVFNGTPVQTLYPLVMPNPNVKWEVVQQYNAGADLVLINQRINLTLDVYIKNTSNMLVSMSVPITTGYSDKDEDKPRVNTGKLRNKGIELTVSTQNLKGAVKWNTDFNVSYNRNRVISINNGVLLFVGGNITNMMQGQVDAAGRPVNSFYGYVTNGIFQNWNEINNYAVQVLGSTAPGDIKFRDLDNSGVIDANDRTYIGNPSPIWTYAMNNSLTYKGFDFQIFLQGIAGNDIINQNAIWQEGMSGPQNQTVKVLDRWTGEGTSNTVPRAVYSDPNQNARLSNRFIEDGSYLRLKNLTLGYTLPKIWSKKAYLETLRLYISCQNLLTFTNYSGFDPEVNVNGVDISTYPVTRTLSFGINVKF